MAVQCAVCTVQYTDRLLRSLRRSYNNNYGTETMVVTSGWSPLSSGVSTLLLQMEFILSACRRVMLNLSELCESVCGRCKQQCEIEPDIIQ